MRDFIVPYLKSLRETIIDTFQSLEPHAIFDRRDWSYQNGDGGGQMAVIRGEIFEKAAVNISSVGGKTFPGSDGQGPFFATGVSLITHMMNPHAPTAHFNLRYIETPEKTWVGGGYDLTPMGYPYSDDTNHFHSTARNALDAIDPELYPKLQKNAAEYFYIPHRKKERGVGGLFFDHYALDEEGKTLAMWQAVGNSFLEALLPIYKRRIETHYTLEEKEEQYKFRAHYAEFNLAYDRGTKFGFQSGGNPDAILCSMPPVAKW